MRCENCAAHWFDLPGSFGPRRIPDSHEELFQKWQSQSLELPESLIFTLREIGGVSDYYGHTISLPARVTLHDGRIYEKALVFVTKQPPLRGYAPEEIVWSSEIATLERAPHALSQEVRRALQEKEEEAMGFTPVGVATADERNWTLAHEGGFVEHEGVLGPELRLAPREKKGFWRREKLVRPTPPQVRVWCDWFEDCRAILG